LDKLVGNLRETVVRNDAPPAEAMPASDNASFAAIDDDDVPF
jgi:hypothetical protein